MRDGQHISTHPFLFGTFSFGPEKLTAISYQPTALWAESRKVNAER
jgi:hypothetical protein